jgi:hypothetical protein
VPGGWTTACLVGLGDAWRNGPGVCREMRKRKEQSYVYMVLLTSKESKTSSRAWNPGPMIT